MDDSTINLLEPRDTTPLPQTPSGRGSRLYIAAVVFLIACIVGIIGYWRYSEAVWAKNPAYNSKTLQPDKPWFLQTIKNFIFSPNNVLVGQENDRINILLLGIGGSGHDGPYLSDTNIILSLKPSTHELAMVSIPRDLSVKINEYGYRKINDADAFGEAKQPGNGGEYARTIFASTFGLDIPYYVRVDFKAFVDMVNTVGGITVDVPKAFVDTSYPGPNDSYQTVRFEPGVQTMDGDRALIYARSRHGNNGEGSDFARARRQQQVILALKEKVLSFGTYTNPTVVKKLIDSLSSNVTTNLDLSQILYLGNFAKEADKSTIKNLVLDDSPTGFLKPTIGSTGAFLLVPKTGTFEAINAAIQNIFSNPGDTPLPTPQAKKPASTSAPTTAPLAPSARIEIQNGTWMPGLATRAKKTAEEQGLSITSFGNSSVRPIEHTAIYILNPNADRQIIDSLAKICHTEATTELPDWLKTAVAASASDPTKAAPYKTTTDLLLILGTDYKP
jgi:LCP family protein required for cell wall assembly